VNGRILEIRSRRARAVRDPTGCGDAYRAGLLFVLVHGTGLADHRKAG